MRIILLAWLFAVLSSCQKEHFLWLKVESPQSKVYRLSVWYREKTNPPLPQILELEFSTWNLWEDGYRIIRPDSLLRQVADSLVILTDDGRRLFFSPDSVIGYRGNPFHEPGLWSFLRYERDFPTNFSRNKALIDEFCFNIRSDSILP